MTDQYRRFAPLPAAVLALSLAATADDRGELPGGAPPLEEIVVTAQRREQPVLSVPVAVTAYSGAELARNQIDDVAGLQFSAPNLLVLPAQGNSRTAAIAMRGQVESDILPTLDPAVGLFLDGVYIARVTGANLELVDVERVEVIRGPQGSLFGRNTIGGAINILPNRPQRAAGGSLQLVAGDFARRELLAVLNTPLGARAAARFALRNAQRDGFARTLDGGTELGDDHTGFLRAQLRLGPESGWDLNLALDYSDTSTGSQWITLLAAMPPATLLPAAAGMPGDSLDNYVDPFARRTGASYAGSFDSRVGGLAARFSTSATFGTVELTVSRRELDLDIVDTDLDGTPYDLATQFRHVQEQGQDSYELQLLGNTGAARVDWIAGLHFLAETATLASRSNSLYPLQPYESVSSSRTRNDSRSAYAHVATSLSPRFRLQVGARLVEDVRRLTSRPFQWRDGDLSCRLDPELADGPERCQATLPPRRFRYAPADLSIAFTPGPGSLAYARYGVGYRAGGYNGRALNAMAALPFDEETVGSVELGFKIAFGRAAARLSMALFRSDYDDIQLVRIVPDAEQRPVVVYVNAGAARIEGGEIELSAAFARVRVRLALGATNARYTRLDPGVVNPGDSNRFDNVPARTASVAAEFALLTGDRELDLLIDYGWRDDVAFGGHALARQAAVGISNARLVLRPGGTSLELSAWARNLTDEHYLERAIWTGNGHVRALPADPRTVGLALAWRFGRG